MKAIHIKQTWEGIFICIEGYEASEQYIEVAFTMDIVLSENSFTGTSTDVESKHVFNRPATVRGFIKDDTISFVVKYPCNYYKDETGAIAINQSAEHPDIHYLGFFDEDKKKVVGNWEMTIFEEKYGDDYLEELLRGEFEMRKVT